MPALALDILEDFRGSFFLEEREDFVVEFGAEGAEWRRGAVVCRLEMVLIL